MARRGGPHTLRRQAAGRMQGRPTKNGKADQCQLQAQLPLSEDSSRNQRGPGLGSVPPSPQPGACVGKMVGWDALAGGRVGGGGGVHLDCEVGLTETGNKLGSHSLLGICTPARERPRLGTHWRHRRPMPLSPTLWCIPCRRSRRRAEQQPSKAGQDTGGGATPKGMPCWLLGGARLRRDRLRKEQRPTGPCAERVRDPNASVVRELDGTQA